MSYEYIRYCVKCGKAFDIAINFRECPECRKAKQEKLNKGMIQHERIK